MLYWRYLILGCVFWGSMGFLFVFFFSLELLGGRQEGCLTWKLYCQNGNLAQRNFLKHQSRIDAKSTIFMLIPTAVCYFIFRLNRQSLSLLSYLWCVSSRNPEQIYHLYIHISSLVWLYCALSWLLLLLQLFQALITPKRRGPIQKKLPVEKGGKGHFCISFPHTVTYNISHPKWKRRSMSHANIMRQVNQ